MVRLDGMTVLVVDDHKDVRESVQMMLSGRGARVSTAASAHEARERLRLFRPSAVVSDLRMPREDGVQLLKSVRRLATDAADVPFVALSAFAEPQDRARARDAGFSVFLAKPASGEEVARGIERAVTLQVTSGEVVPRSQTRPTSATSEGPTARGPRPEGRPASGTHLRSPMARGQSIDLTLLSYKRSSEGSVMVEGPGGRIMALFDRIPLNSRDEWYVSSTPGGLSPEGARRSFAEWTAAGRRCDNDP